MTKIEKPNPERLDEENPEWTLLDIAQARPAVELLKKDLGAKSTDELMRRTRGRPPKEERKVNQTLRIDPDVLDAYRQEGKGWQTHINEVLGCWVSMERKTGLRLRELCRP